MQHSTAFHLTYFQSVAGFNKFQLSLNRPVQIHKSDTVPIV